MRNNGYLIINRAQPKPPRQITFGLEVRPQEVINPSVKEIEKPQIVPEMPEAIAEVQEALAAAAEIPDENIHDQIPAKKKRGRPRKETTAND